MNAELRAMTEHAHNHRPNVRVLHSSPTRCSSPPMHISKMNEEDEESGETFDSKEDSKPNCRSSESDLRQIGCSGDQGSSRQSFSPTRQSPSPTRQSPTNQRQTPTPPRPTPSPSPILTRPGSASKKYTMGRANSVSFLEQDEDDSGDSEESSIDTTKQR